MIFTKLKINGKDSILCTLFIIVCIINVTPANAYQKQPVNNGFKHFKTTYQWTHINYTWPSRQVYKNAVENQQYIPGNILITGFKFYKNRIFLTSPRIRPGIPSTLCYIKKDQTGGRRVIQNPLLTPFPSWKSQILQSFDDTEKCSHLISVYSLSIDQERGTLWAIDGQRVSNTSIETQCPCKLVLIDLHSERIVHVHVFSENVCLKNGGFLNDIVVEDGKYAYITDASDLDPGIVVYSRRDDLSYKIRDESFRVKPNHEPLHLGDYESINELLNVNGIALSPFRKNSPRLLYYTTFGDKTLYSVDTKYLKEGSGYLEKNAKSVGNLQSNGLLGLIMYNEDLYYTLLPLNGVGKYNTEEVIGEAEIYDRSTVPTLWNSNFALDENGYLYLYSFIFKPHYHLTLDGRNNFFISQVHIGTREYHH